MPAWLQQDWCSSFVLALGHFVWQGTLIAIVLAIALRATKTVSARYWLSLAALVVMPCCAGGTLVWLWPETPGSGLQNSKLAAQVVDPTPTPEPPILNFEDLTPASRDVAIPDHPLVTEPPPSAPRSTSPAELPINDHWQQFAPWLTSGYFVGVALMLLRLVFGLWGGRRLRRRVHLIDDSSLLEAMRRQATALGLKLLPVLAYCERVTVPTVVGVLKPMILLPLTLTSGLSPEQIESVLAHELAHLRRCDHLVNLLQRVIESLLFFHPAVWWVSHRIREEREHCCDDLVVACGAMPLDYAKSLLRVAELSRASKLCRSVAAVSLLATGNQKPSNLRQRIARLLGESATPSLRISPRVLMVSITVLLVGLASLIQLGVSNDQPAEANPDESQTMLVVEWSALVDEAVLNEIRALKSNRSRPATETGAETIRCSADELRAVVKSRLGNKKVVTLVPNVRHLPPTQGGFRAMGDHYCSVFHSEIIPNGDAFLSVDWHCNGMATLDEQADGLRLKLAAELHFSRESAAPITAKIKLDEVMADGDVTGFVLTHAATGDWKPSVIVVYEALRIPADHVELLKPMTRAEDWIRRGSTGTKEHVARVAEWRSRPSRDVSAADPVWTRELPNGGHVQLVGIGRTKDAQMIWWTPAGEPLSQVSIYADQQLSNYELAAIVRVWETGTSRSQKPPTGMRIHGGVLDVPDKFAVAGSQLIVVPVVLDKATGKASLKIGAGFGAWTAETKIGSTVDATAVLSGVEIKTQQAHSSKSIDPASPPKLINSTTTAFRWQPTRDFEFTALAVTASGKVVEPLWTPMVYANEPPNTLNGAAFFQHIAPQGDIAEFLLKSRPVHWSEFTGFATEPAVALVPPLDFQSQKDVSGGAAVTRPDKYIAELPDGLKVEFVGITMNTAPAKDGWKPDGLPLGDVGDWPAKIYRSGNTTGTFNENGEHPEPNAGALDLLFRFRGLKAQPSLAFDLAANGVGYSNHLVKDPYELRITTERRSPLPGAKWTIPDGEMRVGLTDEPWGRYVKISPEGKVLDPVQPDERHASTYKLIEVLGAKPHERAPTGKTIVLHMPLTVANTPTNDEGSPDLSHRFAFEFRAIDTEGKSHLADAWHSGQVPGTKLIESQFGLMQPLPAGKTLSHFEYRLRPYRHWVTFQGVSLEQGNESDVKVKVETLPSEPAKGNAKGADGPRDGREAAQRVLYSELLYYGGFSQFRLNLPPEPVGWGRPVQPLEPLVSHLSKDVQATAGRRFNEASQSIAADVPTRIEESIDRIIKDTRDLPAAYRSALMYNLWIHANDLLSTDGHMKLWGLNAVLLERVLCKCSFAGLEQAEEIPDGLTLRFLNQLRSSLSSLKTDDDANWPARRHTMTTLWLTRIERIRAAIDPDWNPKDFPMLNIEGSDGLPSGASPKGLRDPKRLAEYEARLEANRRKAEKYNQQLLFRRLLAELTPHMEEDLIRLYVRKPLNATELESLLEKHASDQSQRERVAKTVRLVNAILPNGTSLKYAWPDALAEAGSAGLPALMAAVRDKSYPHFIRNDGAWALGLIGDPRALETLAAVAQDEDTPEKYKNIAREFLRTLQKNGDLRSNPAAGSSDTRRTKAIEQGIVFLKAQQQAGGAWEGTPTDGVTALAAAALLQAGVKPDDSALLKALAHLRNVAPTHSYTVALQTIVFCAASPKEDAELIRRNVAWLERAQVTEGKSRGSWSYGVEPGGRGDGSCSRFAVLGLDAAKKAGFEVQEETWRRVSDYWLTNQKENDGWGYTPESGTTLTMTLSGIAGLATANRHLPRDEQSKTREAAIRKPEKFIEKAMADLPRATFVLYALQSLERAGNLSDIARFGELDWKADATKLLLETQNRNDGHWKSSNESDVIATSFALLVLSGQPEPKANARAENGVRARREPPAPTAGLPNSDKETNTTNNTSGDLLSKPAAGSGDPRRARAPSAVPPALSFAETTELVLSINSQKFMLDFDSGRTMDPPQTDRPEQKQMDVHPLHARPNEVPAGLQGLSLRGVRMKPDDWFVSVAELQKVLDSDRVGALMKLPYDSDEQATYFFRTADGTDGILTLLEQTTKPKGIRLRYKRFVASKVNAEIKVGMTFDELITLKGRHYRLSHGMRADNLNLVYDDIAISIDAPPNAKGGGKVIGFEPGIPREVVNDVPYADAEPALPKGLEFLKPYPKLHGLSLDMTEPQFLEIVKQQELKTKKTVEGEKVTHHIALGDGHTLLVMFDKDAKCSGIQRVRGEDDSAEPPRDSRRAQDTDGSAKAKAVDDELFLTVITGQTRNLEFDLRVKKVEDFDAKIVKVSAASPKLVQVEGATAGLTIVTVTDEKGTEFAIPIEVVPASKSDRVEPVGAAFQPKPRKNPPLPAVEIQKDETLVELGVKQDRMLVFPQRIRRIDGFDPLAINVVAVDPRQVRVSGLIDGTTTFIAQTERDEHTVKFVVKPIVHTRESIRKLFTAPPPEKKGADAGDPRRGEQSD